MVSLQYELPKLFTFTFLVLVVVACFIFIFSGSAFVDIQLHDSYFVIAVSHNIFFSISLVIGCNALVYYLYLKIFGKNLNETLGKVHFWMTLIGISILLFEVIYLNVAGTVPRRYYNFESFDAYQKSTPGNLVVIAVLIIFASQLLLVVNLVYSLIRGTRVEK